MKFFMNSSIIKSNLIIYLGNDSHINDILMHYTIYKIKILLNILAYNIIKTM